MAMPPLAPKPASRRFTAALYARPRPIIEPDEAVPGTVEAWEAIAPIRPDTAHIRSPRFLDLAGELVSAVLIIAGGVLAYGFLQIA
ncbi:hypothetical protein FV227_05120 [Methylobacterium sp. WL119]|uniref:hypothetical protein n=3 Tax=unclassified Methylobacterium TaxID=2615210 RepID=UPI0011CC7E0B|nr:hypothetical protein [Methylobacterium sp. WL119]TXN52148.1 hypothetical protein FV227_05120 [Methylobacterium sp. WL119]